MRAKSNLVYHEKHKVAGSTTSGLYYHFHYHVKHSSNLLIYLETNNL